MRGEGDGGAHAGGDAGEVGWYGLREGEDMVGVADCDC